MMKRDDASAPAKGCEIALASTDRMTYGQHPMETTQKSVLTDLQAFDVASLKGRLIELRRYL
jgi:hypothetical protein